MHSIWRLTAVLFVSIFGLVSCQSDKTKAEDTWRLAPPMVRLDDEVVIANASQNSRLARIPSHAELHFPSLEGEAGRGVSLTLTTTCSFGDRTETQALVVREVARLPFKSLIPLDVLLLWLASGSQGEADLFCDLSGHATNAIGTQHAFELNDFRLAASERILDFKLRLVPFELPAEILPADRIDISVQVGCENFRNKRRYAGGSQQALLLDLVHGPLGSIGQPYSQSQASQVDPRLRKMRQRCVFVVESPSADSGLPQRLLSHPETLRFPAPILKLEGGYVFVNVYPANFAQHPFFFVRITNPHPIPLRLAVPLDPKESVELQFLRFDVGISAARAEPPFTAKLVFEVEGQGNRWTKNGFHAFEVPAGGQVELTTKLATSVRCHFNEGFQQSSGLATPGFAFRYTMPFPLLMLLDEGDEPTLGASMEAIPIPWPMEMPTGAGSILEGWLPHSEWLRHRGHGVRPLVDGVSPSRSCRR